MTIRRDLRELSEKGLLQRKHGGAISKVRKPASELNDIGIVLISRTGKYVDPFFNAVLEGVDRKLTQLGYRIAYINAQAEVSTVEHARNILTSNPVRGIIVVGPGLGSEAIGYLSSNVPALVQTIDRIDRHIDSVTFDGYSGMRQVVDHLVKLGRRRLGFITGHFDDRQQGFEEGIKLHGVPDDPALRVTVPPDLDGWTPEMGQFGTEQLMSQSRPLDAIVCASDRIAIGAIQWLHQHKVRVPDQIAVTGFDNISDSAFTTPALTTVHVHKQLIGELAAERVVRRIENKDEVPLLIQTPTNLIIRQSCGSQ